MLIVPLSVKGSHGNRKRFCTNIPWDTCFKNFNLPCLYFYNNLNSRYIFKHIYPVSNKNHIRRTPLLKISMWLTDVVA